MIKDKRKYSGDNFYVINYEESKTISLSDIENKANSLGIIKLIFDQIAANNRVVLDDGTEISNSSVFKTLHHIYKKQIQVLKEQQKNGIEKAKQAGKYKGRKPIKVDRLLFLELSERVNRKEITNKEAARRLGISIDKYYRYKKQYKGKDIVLL